MLNIKENKSYNNFVITGTLSTIDVKEGRSKSTDAHPQGQDYVRVNAMVRLDQEINGVLTQCEVPIELYANKDYSKGDVNPIYTNGQKFKDFISLSAAGDKPEKATRISIGADGKKGGTINENVYIPAGTDKEMSITKFRMLGAKEAASKDVDCATFNLNNVVIGSVKEEVNRDGENTGRLKVKVIFVGYQGRVDVVEFIAESENSQAYDFISENWNKGDTVNIVGRIKYSVKDEVKKVEQAFGEPLVEHYTKNVRELIITGGTMPNDEAQSYDMGDIQQALAERQARIEQAKQKANSVNKQKTSNVMGSEFDF